MPNILSRSSCMTTRDRKPLKTAEKARKTLDLKGTLVLYSYYLAEGFFCVALKFTAREAKNAAKCGIIRRCR